ncbi:MAG: SUMF1/EgtB/PvdO family nonheme iron enzyme, partial [Arenimonas sp.]
PGPRQKPRMQKFLSLLSITALCLAMSACGPDQQTASKATVPVKNAPTNAGNRVSKNTKQSSEQLNLPKVDASNLAEAFRLAELDFAAARYEDSHHVAPAALEWYLAIMRFDSANTKAQAGLASTLDALVLVARQDIRSGNLTEATRLLRVIELGGVAHPEISILKFELAKAGKAETLQKKAVELERQKLVLPSGAEKKSTDALTTYHEALKLFPDYQPTIKAIDRLRSQRERAALSLAKQSKFEAALIVLKQAALIDDKNPQYQMVANHVNGRLNQVIQEQIVLANLALDGMRIEIAEDYYIKAKKILSSHAEVAALARRIDEAKHYARYRPGQFFNEPWAMSNPTPEMVVIPYGNYEMGALKSVITAIPAELPRHTVTFKRGFAIARNEITVAQFRQFIESSGYKTRATARAWSMVFDEKGGSMTKRENVDWRHDHLGRPAKDDLPVVHVNFDDAQAYARWLSEKTGETYRLPSEAEFEYVLRAGGDTLYPWGDQAPKHVVANLAGAGDKSTQSRSWGNAIVGYRDFHWGGAPVRSFPQESWGTFDISGNVEEWVQDCWHESYQRAPLDSSAWVNPGCKTGVTRGASWASSLDEARVSFRTGTLMKTHNARIGFRVVRAL